MFSLSFSERLLNEAAPEPSLTRQQHVLKLLRQLQLFKNLNMSALAQITQPQYYGQPDRVDCLLTTNKEMNIDNNNDNDQTRRNDIHSNENTSKQNDTINGCIIDKLREIKNSASRTQSSTASLHPYATPSSESPGLSKTNPDMIPTLTKNDRKLNLVAKFFSDLITTCENPRKMAILIEEYMDSAVRLCWKLQHYYLNKRLLCGHLVGETYVLLFFIRE